MGLCWIDQQKVATNDALIEQILCISDMRAVRLENTFQSLFHADARLPVQIGTGVLNLGYAVFYILIAVAVVAFRLYFDKLHFLCGFSVLRILGGQS